MGFHEVLHVTPSRGSAFLVLGIAALPAPVRAATDSGAFVMSVGRDTIALENFTRTGDVVQGALLYLPAKLRFDYSISLGPDGAALRMENVVRPASAAASARPTQSASLEWQADSVIADVQPGGAQRLASKPGSMPYLNPSLLMMELIVKRAGASTPPLGSVPVFLVSGGQTLNVSLRFASGDSLELSLAGSVIGLRIDAHGHILSGSIAAQGVRFERVESLPDDRMAVLPPDHSPPPGRPHGRARACPRAAVRAGRHADAPTWRSARRASSQITGSGPQDRDERIVLVRGYRPFRQLADTLARRGIAVLRLDDRGTGESGGRFEGSTSADFSDDIDDAYKWRCRQPGIDVTHIALLGHSEGGVIAPIVALREPASEHSC